jgi:hypothetical protein
MNQRLRIGVVLTTFAVICGCGPQETAAERQREADSAAGKLGQAAHKAAVQADKASRVIGKQLQQAAHDAHEGWKQDARKKSEPGR